MLKAANIPLGGRYDAVGTPSVSKIIEPTAKLGPLGPCFLVSNNSNAFNKPSYKLVEPCVANKDTASIADFIFSVVIKFNGYSILALSEKDTIATLS